MEDEMDRQRYEAAIVDLEESITSTFSNILPNELPTELTCPPSQTMIVAHIKTMLPRMREFLVEGRISKLDRWLGSAQTFAICAGIRSLDHYKAVNRGGE